MTILLPLYRIMSTVGAPAIYWYLKRRLARGQEDRLRFDERKGIGLIARPAGPLIWVHGASVGESLTILPLINRLLEICPGLHVLVTTGTVTSATLLDERLPQRAIHQYVPIDRQAYVRRFLDHWRPELALWIESEFWPNLVTITSNRGIPLILLNGRVSPESFAGWRKARGLMTRMLRCFTLCLAQTDTDADRLRALGASQVEVLGNLKYATPALPADMGNLDFLRDHIGTRPCWLAASTHPGEEALVGGVHQALKTMYPNLITIIVPRHPDRGKAIAEALSALGLTVMRRSKGDAIVSKTDIYLADTLGELGLFFRLSPISFMGKSLVDLGGQNPLEPARLGSAVLFGPHMWNFADISRRLLDADAAVEVGDANALTAAVDRLLADSDLCEARGQKGKIIADSENDVLDRVTDALAPYISDAVADRKSP